MSPPIRLMEASLPGSLGKLFAGVVASASTLRLISCKEVMMWILLSGVCNFSKRELRHKTPVEIARFKFEETTTLLPASPRMMETKSGTLSSPAGLVAHPGSKQPSFWDPRKASKSHACCLPSAESGESKNTESCTKSMDNSVIKALISLTKNIGPKPLLNTRFHSDSPWRMNTIFFLWQLAKSTWVLVAGLVFLSDDAKKYHVPHASNLNFGT
mmetsp:Transcript_57557/g.134853  ORF Transcript_57557/g.134853 Transcript_57557/m.134853 type:complete len:214 (+) Transcript_57557:475-1116(+)